MGSTKKKKGRPDTELVNQVVSSSTEQEQPVCRKMTPEEAEEAFKKMGVSISFESKEATPAVDSQMVTAAIIQIVKDLADKMKQQQCCAPVQEAQYVTIEEPEIYKEKKSEKELDDFLEDEVFWNPNPTLETVGYAVAGAAATVGVAALLHHFIKK